MTSMRSFALTPGRIILLIVLFLLAAAVAFLTHLPANWIWSQAQPHVALPPGIKVEAVGGTLWSGSGLVSLSTPGLPDKTLRLTWSAGLPSFQGRLPLDWRVESRQSWAEGELMLAAPEQVDIHVARGLISLDEFSDLARRNGLTLPGSITLQSLRFELAGNRLVEARGTGRWDGGPVTWRMGEQSGSAQFPPLAADLQDQDGGIAVAIETEAEAMPLIDLVVAPDGMVSMAVRRRLLELSGMPAGNGSPTDTVFRMQQRVLQ